VASGVQIQPAVVPAGVKPRHVETLRLDGMTTSFPRWPGIAHARQHPPELVASGHVGLPGRHAQFGIGLIGIGLIHLRKGDVDKAIPVREQGVRLCETANIPAPCRGRAIGFGSMPLPGAVSRLDPFSHRSCNASLL
jgi:hypothetical protein